MDMRVDMPRANIDDPGIGLRDNGRKVLTYADLHTIGGPLDKRGPGREIELHLTGNMQRYMWSFDGQKFSDAKPCTSGTKERLRIVLVNDTMMPHPIHLHGMWSEMESPAASSRSQAHHHGPAGAAGHVPGQRGRARQLGIPLPSALSHGGGMFRKVVVS